MGTRELPPEVRDFILRWIPSGHIDRVQAFERDAELLYKAGQRNPIKDEQPKRQLYGGNTLPVGHDIP